MRKFLYTTQAELRRAFRSEFRHHLPFRHLKGGEWDVDTRCAFVDWIDGLQKEGQISESLAWRATL